jgi:hypothetical protein
MSVENEIDILKSEISKGMSVLTRIENYYQSYIKKKCIVKKMETEQAIVISDVICNYYTCLETIFIRISQFFENNLLKEKWHQDLLNKMVLQIDNIREAVISEETYNNLLELLKFRYFKRYYFGFNYDWEKLDFIQKKFNQSIVMIKKVSHYFYSFLKD